MQQFTIQSEVMKPVTFLFFFNQEATNCVYLACNFFFVFQNSNFHNEICYLQVLPFPSRANNQLFYFSAAREVGIFVVENLGPTVFTSLSLKLCQYPERCMYGFSFVGHCLTKTLCDYIHSGIIQNSIQKD